MNENTAGTSGVATGEFDIDLKPGQPLIPGTGRFDFTKTWTGDLAGTSTGSMLSAGDPSTGTAGYVALEMFEGTLAGRSGGFAFQQNGTMSGGADQLTYVITPGTGWNELAGITGTLAMEIDDDGTHRVSLTYAFA